MLSILEWCSDVGAAAIPYGSGSSVVGGVEPDIGDGYRGAVSVDMRNLAGVLEVDPVSRAARIAAGTEGPALEAELRPHGLTLRHFPQSFEYSTLGGWIATRSGGHFATLQTHIDEFVEAVRVVTPSGQLETRRLPASGAGPSPERLFCGSEGTLGVICQAWMRLQPRPRFRAGASVYFASFEDAVQSTRAVAQSGLNPSNCRLLGHDEALLSGSGDGSHAILVLGFESGDHPLEPWMARALEICAEHRGQPGAADDQAAATWRAAFLRGPHLRDAFAQLGFVHETFETAVTWDRFDDFHERVLGATQRAVKRRAAPARSHAGSRTSTRTAPRRITRSTRPAAPARSSSSGTRSSAPRRRRSSPVGAQSHITTPSGAIIVPHTYARCRSCSPVRCVPLRPSSTRQGS